MRKFGVDYEALHFNRVDLVTKKINQLYLSVIREASIMSNAVKFDDSKPFSFSDYPQTQKRIDKLINGMSENMTSVIDDATKSEWLAACAKNDALVESLVEKTKFKAEQIQSFGDRNLEALNAFQTRKTNGLDLSDRVWKYSNQFKGDIEMGLDLGLGEGKSAAEISRDLRSYLVEPDKLFRRVRDKHGILRLSENAKKYNPDGAYRSSYKNAMRLTITETNMAYRSADHERMKSLDFVVGFEVVRSNHAFDCPVCNSLKGKYPKEFQFVGWHPHCYDELSEVMTNRGWKFFKDVEDNDLILSINPETKLLEWTGIELNFNYEYKGKMVHFHNRSLDCLVTPEHEMFYGNKSDGRFKRCTADEFTKGKGHFYRGAEWVGVDNKTITIRNTVFEFDAFAEFLGYWLSDGSLIRKSQIKIAQMNGDLNKPKIKSCIERLGLKCSENIESLNCYSKDLNLYLKQFGKSACKFIPKEIKESSVRQINIFMNAFISCDGYIRPAKSFIGSRGSIFTSDKDERIFFTTSKQMSADLGELLLKIGKRPSYHIEKVKGKVQQFRNGSYVINEDSIKISECSSMTATVFEKDYVDYDGVVYDLTLSKNSTMYIRRNGKCFWGSNCRCHVISILATEDEFINQQQKILNGEEPDFNSVNSVSEIPNNFTQWVKDNQDRIDNAKSKPYFLKDNSSLIK